jgi:putative DNA primase/helicase
MASCTFALVLSEHAKDVDGRHGAIEPAVFSEALKNAAVRTYGTAGPAFIEGLADDPAMVEKVARIQTPEVTSKLLAGIPQSDGQAHRVAARFALVAVAGNLARESLDVPWAEGEALQAAIVCFEAWRESRGGEGPGEYVAAMDALRVTTESYGESRFRNLDPATPAHHGMIVDLLGYRLEEGGRRCGPAINNCESVGRKGRARQRRRCGPPTGKAHW